MGRRHLPSGIYNCRFLGSRVRVDLHRADDMLKATLAIDINPVVPGTLSHLPSTTKAWLGPIQGAHADRWERLRLLTAYLRRLTLPGG